MSSILIADSGSTKTEWCLLHNGRKKTIFTAGLSPYFLSQEQVTDIIAKEVAPKTKHADVEEIYFYGTGCSNLQNVKLITKAIKSVYPSSKISVDHDLMGAAKSLCGDEKGIACILGTGSNSCYYNGKKIVKNNPGLGYVLGDEGSGAYLGKKVIQYYMYKTFDEDLNARFENKYKITGNDILDAVYKQPLPNAYLASFVGFLSENRGHYMIENIIEDGINDFFFNHIYKYSQSWSLPIHFTGGVAYEFRDVLAELCHSYELQLGKIIKNPMVGLLDYHR